MVEKVEKSTQAFVVVCYKGNSQRNRTIEHRRIEKNCDLFGI